jgi:hypothetical protein
VRVGQPPAPPSRAEHPWHLPREVIGCVNLVFEVARREGRTVAVVDVSHPGEHQELVDRWVGPDDPLPMLVRSDGAKLGGTDKFAPPILRQFVRRR